MDIKKYFEDGLTFVDESHTYTYAGKELMSVTTFLKDYFSFESEEVAAKLALSKWGRYKDIDCPKEILQMWQDKADLGTSVHKFAEDYLNGEFVSIECPEMVAIYKYLQKLDYDEVICEQRIFDETLGLAGTVDLLIKIKGRWYIYDFKTDREIRQEGYKGEMCPGILCGFPKCNFTKYCFQLGIYNYILETKYDVPIYGRKILHVTADRVIEYGIPYHSDYIQALIQKKVQTGM